MLLLVTGTAHAGTVSVNGSVISFQAKPGEVNDLNVNVGPVGYGADFTDAAAPLQAGEGCTTDPLGKVSCPYPDETTRSAVVEVHLGDRNDHLDFDGDAGGVKHQMALGGRGDDNIFVGGSSGDYILERGGPGADDLRASTNHGGYTTMEGGSGRDHLSVFAIGGIHMLGGPDADTLDLNDSVQSYTYAATSLDGGAGSDNISIGPANSAYLPIVAAGPGFDTLSFDSGPGQADLDFNACPGCGVERVVGSKADDTLIGDSSSMQFYGGAGNDTIDPGGGFDAVFAGAGDDHVSTVDHSFDLAACGTDQDTATGNRFDLFFADCEKVTR